MAEYLFSRVIPRADLGWSQVERLRDSTRMVSIRRCGNCSISRQLVKTDPAFLFRHEWHGDLPAFYILSHSTPQDRAGLWSNQSKPYAPQLETERPASFAAACKPGRNLQWQTPRRGDGRQAAEALERATP